MIDIKIIQMYLEPIFSKIHLPILILCSFLVFIASIRCLYVLEKHKLQRKIAQNKQKLSDDNISDTNISDKNSSNPDDTTNNNKHKAIKHLMLWRFLTSCTVFLTGITWIFSLSLFYTAYQHGFREYMKQNIHDIIHSVEYSPEEDTLPNDITNITVIYYRFGCKDCEKMYHSLSEKFDNVSDVYWIATRSKQGTKLRETFPIETVPSAIYISDKETAVSFEFYSKSTENNKTTIELNENGIEDLFKYRSKHIQKRSE